MTWPSGTTTSKTLRHSSWSPPEVAATSAAFSTLDSNGRLSWLVFEEAHLFLTSAFRPDLKTVLSLTTTKRASLLFLTATLPLYLEEELKEATLSNPKTIRMPTTRPNLCYGVIQATSHATAIGALVDLMREEAKHMKENDRTIVYLMKIAHCDVPAILDYFMVRAYSRTRTIKKNRFRFASRSRSRGCPPSRGDPPLDKASMKEVFPSMSFWLTSMSGWVRRRETTESCPFRLAPWRAVQPDSTALIFGFIFRISFTFETSPSLAACQSSFSIGNWKE